MREFDNGSKPHSKGEIFSRSINLFFEIRKLIDNIIIEIKERIKNIEINVKIIYINLID